jgi:hypothetical protein
MDKLDVVSAENADAVTALEQPLPDGSMEPGAARQVVGRVLGTEDATPLHRAVPQRSKALNQEFELVRAPVRRRLVPGPVSVTRKGCTIARSIQRPIQLLGIQV